MYKIVILFLYFTNGNKTIKKLYESMLQDYEKVYNENFIKFSAGKK